MKNIVYQPIEKRDTPVVGEILNRAHLNIGAENRS